MLLAVEPDIAEAQAVGGIVHQLDRTANVIGIDVSDNEQIEVAVGRTERLDALLEARVGRRTASVDENAALRRTIVESNAPGSTVTFAIEDYLT